MPLFVESDYRPPLFLFNGHLQMVWANIFRRVGGVYYQRERIDTPDGDFLDLDWARVGAGRLAIVSHGLEGYSRRPYALGMVKALNRRGWDVLAWHYRGCSGELNRLPRFYHSGDTDDLATVVDCVLDSEKYESIALIGFSLGGNLLLKYLGERGGDVHGAIKGGVAFSVPCDLSTGSERMNAFENKLYLRRFIVQLRQKVRARNRVWPGKLQVEALEEIRTFQQFDERYTAPLHGFEDAEDYYCRSSCRSYLEKIRAPVLIVNARNDLFLSEECYPEDEAKASEFVFLEMPEQGGHVGFPLMEEEYWSEKRAAMFLEFEGKVPCETINVQ